MRPIQIVILLFALVAAGGAGLMAMRLAGREPETVTVVEQAPVEYDEVLVAAEDIRIGSAITEERVRWQTWPKGAPAEQYLVKGANPSALDDVKGMLARSSFAAGEPIQMRKLVRTDRGFLSAVLKPGMRASAVRVTSVATAGGFILPEDRVDILLTRNGADGKVQSETILTDIRVLAIDQTVEQVGEEKQAVVVAQDSATLELTPDQVEIVAQAQQMGTLSLALRPLAEANTDSQPARSREQAAGVNLVRYGISTRVPTRVAE